MLSLLRLMFPPDDPLRCIVSGICLLFLALLALHWLAGLLASGMLWSVA